MKNIQEIQKVRRQKNEINKRVYINAKGELINFLRDLITIDDQSLRETLILGKIHEIEHQITKRNKIPFKKLNNL